MKKLWGEIAKEEKDWISDEIDFIFVYTSDTEFQSLLFGLCETPNFRIVLVYKANQSFRAVSCPEKRHFLLIIGRNLTEKVIFGVPSKIGVVEIWSHIRRKQHYVEKYFINFFSGH